MSDYFEVFVYPDNLTLQNNIEILDSSCYESLNCKYIEFVHVVYTDGNEEYFAEMVTDTLSLSDIDDYDQFILYEDQEIEMVTIIINTTLLGIDTLSELLTLEYYQK